MAERNKLEKMRGDLVVQFAQHIFDHPDFDDAIDGAYIFFQVAGEDAFNRAEKRWARRLRSKGERVVFIRTEASARGKRARFLRPEAPALLDAA